MVKAKHKGPRAKGRYATRKSMRERGMPTVNKMLQEFKRGQSVHVKINSSIHSAMPHRRFNGKTGLIEGKRGSCYLVKVRDMHALKTIIVHPAHLTLVKEEKEVKGEKNPVASGGKKAAVLSS